MSMIAANKGGGQYPQPSEGTTIGICRQVLDVGTQYDDKWNKLKHKIVLGWELPNEIAPATDDKPEEPFLIWRWLTLSLHEKSDLRPLLEAWRGRAFTEEELEGFDVKTVLNAPCMINITNYKKNDGTIKAQVNSVMAIPKGTVVPKPHHPAIVFDLDEFDKSVFDGFGDSMQKIIMSSEEMKAKQAGQQKTDAAAETDGPAPWDEQEHKPIDEESIPF